MNPWTTTTINTVHEWSTRNAAENIQIVYLNFWKNKQNALSFTKIYSTKENQNVSNTLNNNELQCAMVDCKNGMYRHHVN